MRAPAAPLPGSASADHVTARDALPLLGYAALAGLLLTPLRHYRGSRGQVDAAKFDRDSFPLSTYPMFSTDRRGRLWLPHVVGFTASGRRVIPHYRLYGAGGLNQVRKQIARAVRAGRAAEVAQTYADALAAGSDVTDSDAHDADPIVRVEVVRSRFVFADYFGTDATPGIRAPRSEIVHSECAVGGRAIVRHATRRTARAAA